MQPSNILSLGSKYYKKILADLLNESTLITVREGVYSCKNSNAYLLFVDLEKQDFHLKADSPLRGKAINLSELYKIDFNGHPLPKTGNWDIGAIQYNATKPTKTLQPKQRYSYP